MGTPHDTWFHFTFRHANHAKAWLEFCLPAGLVAALDWSTLRLCSEKVHGFPLRLGTTDIVFEVRTIDSGHLVYLLIEHRSYRCTELHDKLLRYSVHLSHGRRRTRGEHPAPVVPIVLYHGPGALDLRPRPLRAPGLDPAALTCLESMQPRIQCIPDEIRGCTEEQILGRKLSPLGTLTLLSLRFLPDADPEQTLAAIDRWGALLRAADQDDGPPIGREAIANFGWYVLHVTETPAHHVHMAIERNLGRPEETIMSTAEKLRREGKAEGKAETLLRQLRKRFGPLPPSAEQRLRAGTPEQLDLWTDRILDATSIDGVFVDS